MSDTINDYWKHTNGKYYKFICVAGFDGEHSMHEDPVKPMALWIFEEIASGMNKAFGSSIVPYVMWEVSTEEFLEQS